MKHGLIDGSLPKLVSNSPHLALWTRCNNMVLSWLLNSMFVEIRNSVSYFSTAKEIWDDLAVRFSQTNMPRVFSYEKILPLSVKVLCQSQHISLGSVLLLLRLTI